MCQVLTRVVFLTHMHPHTCTMYLVLGDIVGIPESLLEVIIVWAGLRVHKSDLHSSPRLIVWTVLGPVGRVITLLPGC